ncbi:MAG: amino acid permease [Planctomycetota bacterium]|nr:amino acid permease [Planctomycetota bacterium]MDA1177785.1 amino acid permease [Planctomycetota bacterium]
MEWDETDRVDPLQGNRVASLGLWDTFNILVGIVVGTAIFRSPPMVFQNSSGPWSAIVAWLVGGTLSLLGALCYAELATSYRREGGDYSFLRSAFGPQTGFLFAWAQLTVVLTGSLSAMSYAFADYAGRLVPLSENGRAATAMLAIVMMTLFNLCGTSVGRRMQNFLSCTKLLGLVLLVFSGIYVWGTRENLADSHPFVGQHASNWGLTLVFVLYAFGGWNDAAFVAAEVRDVHRNLPRALALGLGAVTLVYLLVNLTYLSVLGFEGAGKSETPAADVLQIALGDWGATAITVLVMISAAGAIQGMIFTGARVYACVGVDHRSLRWLSWWDPNRGVPFRALLAQATVSSILVGLVGTGRGRGMLDTLLGCVGIPAVPWTRYHGGFETLVAGSAPIFWVFFLATGVSLFVLRRAYPHQNRGFSVPFFPVTPLLFCVTCVYMLYSSLCYARALAVLAVLPLLVGLLIFNLFERNRGER